MDTELAASGVVRATGDDVRLLSFETAQVALEIQVERVGEQLSLRGLVSGARGQVVVEATGVRRAAPIDTEGSFALVGLRRGPMRLLLRAEDGTAVTISWVLF